MSPAARAAVASTLKRVVLRRGESLYTPEQPSEALYVVSSGKVKLTQRGSDGRECVLALAGPGQMFGEYSLFTTQPANTSATAVTRSEVLRMAAEDARRLTSTVPEFAQALLWSVATRLQEAHDTTAALVLSDAPSRLARLLLQLAERYGRHEPDGIVINHELTQQELAHMVGASRETVNKALVEFSNRDWIYCRSRSITILNPAKLTARAS